MSNSSQYYDLASLAEASYVLFNNLSSFSDENVWRALYQENSDIYNGSYSATQADEFVKTWEVVSHQANTDSGFSATLFRNREDGKYYYACRGTEGLNDIFLTDVADIVTDGLAINQIVDMYNDWQRITSLGVYQAAKLDILVEETALLAAERLATPGSITGPYKLSIPTDFSSSAQHPKQFPLRTQSSCQRYAPWF